MRSKPAAIRRISLFGPPPTNVAADYDFLLIIEETPR
jgi:hypothetical protein